MGNYKVCLTVDEDLPRVGMPVYVAEERYVGPNRRGRWGVQPIHGRCSRAPFRGNMSRKKILRGWCGTTNDYCLDSVGVGVVVAVEPAHWSILDGWKLRVRLAREGSKREAEILEQLNWDTAW